MSLKLPRRINPGRRGARAELLTLDTAHKLPHSLERTEAPEADHYITKQTLRSSFPKSSFMIGKYLISIVF